MKSAPRPHIAKRWNPRSLIYGREDARDEAMGLDAQLRRITRVLSSLIAMAIVLAVVDSLVVLLFLQPQLDRQVQGALGLEQLNAGMLNEESGIRAYLVLRDGPFLAEYRDARAVADDGSGQLSRAIGNDSALSSSLVRLQVAQSAWYDEWAVPTIAVPPLPGDTRALQATITNDRGLFGRYQAAEKTLSGEIQGQISSTNSTERTIHVLSATAAAIVWGVLLSVGTRQRRRLGHAIVEPVDSILQAIRAVARGELGARPEPGGPVELRAIATGLGEMAESLAAERGLRAAGETELKEANARLARNAENLNELAADRQRLLTRTLDAAEQERTRVALELHDGPIQRLTAVGFTVDRLHRRAVALGSETIVNLALTTRRQVTVEIDSLRKIMSAMRPPVLDHSDLDGAIRDWAASFERSFGITCEVTVSLDSNLIREDMATVLYRITQEALANVAKHAQATHVGITLAGAGAGLTLSIADNGVGFDQVRAAGPARMEHFGLDGIRQRVAMISGHFDIASTSPGGTTLTVTTLDGVAPTGRAAGGVPVHRGTALTAADITLTQR